jgi:uncharacterized protein (DUF2236 family)
MEGSRSWWRREGRRSVRTRLLAGVGLDLPPLEPGIEGDPGLFGPGSLVWRVARERGLLMAGSTALLLQVAHPLVAAGVVDHSGFGEDPFQRLRSTLDATLRITFGDTEQAAEAGRGVAAVHRRVRGRLTMAEGRFPEGTRYDAGDPELAMWVYATLIATSVEAYERFVGSLGPDGRERHYQQAKPFARLFGVTDAVLPADHAAFRAYFDGMVEGPDLAVGPAARRLAAGILHPPVPWIARPSLPIMRLLCTSLLPPRLRVDFGLSWGGWDRAMARAAARLVRTGVRFAPLSHRYWPHHRVALQRMGKEGNEPG